MEILVKLNNGNVGWETAYNEMVGTRCLIKEGGVVGWKVVIDTNYTVLMKNGNSVGWKNWSFWE